MDTFGNTYLQSIQAILLNLILLFLLHYQIIGVQALTHKFKQFVKTVILISIITKLKRFILLIKEITTLQLVENLIF